VIKPITLAYSQYAVILLVYSSYVESPTIATNAFRLFNQSIIINIPELNTF